MCKPVTPFHRLAHVEKLKHARRLLNQPDSVEVVLYLLTSCAQFVDAINATGGLSLLGSSGDVAPYADTEWLDLGDATVTAAKALSRANVDYELQQTNQDEE